MKEKRTANRKRVLSLFLLLVMVFTTAFGTVSTVEAASGKATSKWARAYLKVIAKKKKQDTRSAYTYDLVYFNKDKTPELVVGQNGYWVSMYTYSGGKARKVIDHWGYGAMGNAGYSYLPKKNVLFFADNDYAGAIRYYYYMSIKNNKMVNKYKKSLFETYFKNLKASNLTASSNLRKTPAYYYGNKKISKSKFNNYTIGGNYKVLMGKYTYKEMKALLNTK